MSNLVTLRDLLNQNSIDSSKTMVMRHRPTEPELRRALPWLAAEKINIYNAYQRQHGEVVEKSISKKAKYIASFIGHQPGQAVYIGLFSVQGFKQISNDQYWNIKENAVLKTLGTRGPSKNRKPLWFDLKITSVLSEWKGKLVIHWPSPERSWWRWADRNTFQIHAILPDSILTREMPQWNKLILSWAELNSIPSTWEKTLSEWRGIYHILDSSTGKSYVGSAYGKDNLLGRWLHYSASKDGGNVQLKKINPENLYFSILQRVSPDAHPEEVIALESSWKERLGTRVYGLNSN